METLQVDRREVLKGALALLAGPLLPNLAIAREREEVAARIRDFLPYQHPSFGREQHEDFHAYLETRHGFAENPTLKRFHSDPSKVYVNENAGESIHITGVNLDIADPYVEMIWVLAPAYTDERGQKVVAHVPFEHEHCNQDESFEGLEGRLIATLDGEQFEFEGTQCFTAHAGQEHIAWNPSAQPLAMRVQYRPAYGEDGESSLMAYWGFVNNPDRTDEQGRPKNKLLLGALTDHLRPQSAISGISPFLVRLAAPLLNHPLNPKEVCALYRELTGRVHPLAA